MKRYAIVVVSLVMAGCGSGDGAQWCQPCEAGLACAAGLLCAVAVQRAGREPATCVEVPPPRKAGESPFQAQLNHEEWLNQATNCLGAICEPMDATGARWDCTGGGR